MVTFKILFEPTEEKIVKFFKDNEVDLPDNFIHGNEISFHIFKSEKVGEIIVSRTYNLNCKTKMSRERSESLKLKGGNNWKC